MTDRLRPVLTVLLLPWTAWLCWLYADSLARGSLLTVLLPRRGVLLGGALAVGLPAAALWMVETRWGRRAAFGILLLLVGALATAIAAAAQVLQALVAAVLLVAAAYGWGNAVTRWVGLEDLRRTWQGAPLLTALGWGLLLVAGLAAGTAGALTRPVVAGIGLVGVALAVVSVRSTREAERAPTRKAQPGSSVFWWWGMAALLLIGLVGAVAPEVRYDALAEHLPIAREFVRRAAIVEMRENLASYFQLNGVVLYAMGMTLISGAELPKLMHFSAGVIASLLVYSLGARLWGARVGLAASAIVASTPLVWWVGEAAYTDLWLAMFVTATAESMVLFAARPHPRRAFVVGLLAGAALGTKVTGVTAVLPLVAIFLMWIGTSPDHRPRWAMFAALAAGGIATGSYFFVRSWILTGNPAFPLLNTYFKSPYFSLRNTRTFLSGVGMGEGPVDLLLIPWRVTRYPARFFGDYNIGIVYLALLPAALLAVVRARAPRWLAGAVAAAGIIWFLTAQYLRFFLPVLPLAAIIAAAGLLADPLPRRTAIVSGAVLLLGIFTVTGSWVASGPWNFPLSVVRHTITRDAYTATYVKDYAVAKYASRALPPSARIYGMGVDLSFYYDRTFVPTSWHGNLFNRALDAANMPARSDEEIQTILSRAGFTHFVASQDAPIIARRRLPDGTLPPEVFGEDGPRLEYSAGGYYLFRLQSPR